MNLGRRNLLFVVSLGVATATASLAEGQTATDSTQAPSPRHAAVCPGPSALETARCHALVVTDDFGQPQVTAVPSGYGPADLRSAYAITGSGAASTLIAVVDAYGYPNAES